MTSILEEIGKLHDKELLKWLTEGKDQYDEEGNLIGKRQLTAAEMTVIQKRLAQCGIEGQTGPRSVLDQIRQNMKKEAWKFPGLIKVDGEKTA